MKFKEFLETVSGRLVVYKNRKCIFDDTVEKIFYETENLDCNLTSVEFDYENDSTIIMLQDDYRYIKRLSDDIINIIIENTICDSDPIIQAQDRFFVKNKMQVDFTYAVGVDVNIDLNKIWYSSVSKELNDPYRFMHELAQLVPGDYVLICKNEQGQLAYIISSCSVDQDS